MNCRHCKKELAHTFLDLGYAPPSNAYLTSDQLNGPEVYYPLRIKVCTTCWLVQTEDYARVDELFSPDYAYFSSTSKSWTEHTAQYAENIITKLGLNSSSFVIEVASNDGYLLRNFVEKQIPCLGIEPTDSTANAAEGIGVTTLREFFDGNLASTLKQEGKQADLIIGNNVYAHVPDINDFTLGLKTVLKPGGTITLEFPHILQLILNNQFDTVYHEHYSYLSLRTVISIFESVGLNIYDVEEISTHGGSLRVYGCHCQDARNISQEVERLLRAEEENGITTLTTYLGFQNVAEKIKDDFVDFLITSKKERKSVAAYGAAAKGNTLINFSGVKPDLLSFVCDASSSKKGKYLPGSHIPIKEPEHIDYIKPDYIVIFPWNIKDEVMSQLAFVKDWGAKFVVFVPELRII